MAKNSITDYSKTASLNTDIQSVDIDEGCLPSGINNAIRELMADLAAMNDGTVSLTSPSFSSVNIDAGTIDGTVIGGTTAAAGSFTTGQFNTSLNVDGTVTADGLTVDGTSLIENGNVLRIERPDGATNSDIYMQAGGQGGLAFLNKNNDGFEFKFAASGDKLTIANNGDISFYEDTGTTPKLFWDASAESLGIGTSSPDTVLHIKSTSGNDGLRIETASTDNGFIHFADAEDDNIGRIVYSHSENSMQFVTSDAEAMRIDSAGRLGIGCNSPAIQGVDNADDLVIGQGDGNHGITISSFNTSNGTLAFIDTTNATVGRGFVDYDHNVDAMSFGTLSTERLRITSAGRIGIGTSSTASSSAVKTLFSNTTGGTYLQTNSGSNGGAVWGTDGGGSAVFFTYTGGIGSESYSERMRIDSSGRVGIGTSSPDATSLHVHTGSAGTLTPNSAADDLVVENNGNAGITIASPDANYSGIIFSSPTDATGSIIEYNQSGATFDIGTAISGGVLRLRSGNFSEAMRIDSSGNVGIGTSSPSTPLEVSSSTPYLTLKYSGGTGTSSRATIIGENNDGTTWSLGGVTGSGHLGIVNAKNADTYFSTNNTERLRITSAGLVGINRTSPNGLFHMQSPSGTDSALYIQTSAGTDDSVIHFGDDSASSVGSILYDHSTDSMQFETLNSERLRITSAGLVGIGTSSPVAKLHIENGDMRIEKDTKATIGFRGHTSGSTALAFRDANAAVDRMTIDSSGNVLFGNAVSQIEPRNYTSSNQVGAQLTYGTGDGHEFATPTGVFFNNTSAGSTSLAVLSIRRRGSVTGSITNTATTTAYNTASDHRLKENIADLTGAIARVKSLQPKRFNFIADDSVTVDGFIAHEAAMVVPEAVTGEKDAVDEDGNPDYQGIDQSKLVPLLTAALQEAITKIEDLEARVATLEGN